MRTRIACTQSIQQELAPQSNSVALGSSPRAHCALVVCGLWAGTECRASSEHLTPNRARERLSRLSDSEQLAELCDETSHRASLRPARGVSIGAFGLRTGRRTKVPHFAVYLSTVPARCSCRARSPVAWVAAARGGSRRPKRQRERPPSLFMSRSPLPSSFGPSPRGAASPRGH